MVGRLLEVGHYLFPHWVNLPKTRRGHLKEVCRCACEAVFLDTAGKRVGTQFYSLDAAQSYLSRGEAKCPVTSLPIAKVQEVPSITKDFWTGPVARLEQSCVAVW